jgi:hypothetical protein
MTMAKRTAQIIAASHLLTRVRKIKVISVDCSFSDKGILRARTVIRIDGKRITVGAVTWHSLLQLLTGKRGVDTNDAIDAQPRRPQAPPRDTEEALRQHAHQHRVAR